VRPSLGFLRTHSSALADEGRRGRQCRGLAAGRNAALARIAPCYRKRNLHRCLVSLFSVARGAAAHGGGSGSGGARFILFAQSTSATGTHALRFAALPSCYATYRSAILADAAPVAAGRRQAAKRKKTAREEEKEGGSEERKKANDLLGYLCLRVRGMSDYYSLRHVTQPDPCPSPCVPLCDMVMTSNSLLLPTTLLLPSHAYDSGDEHS